MTDARYIALPLISRYHCLDPTNRDISGLHCNKTAAILWPDPYYVIAPYWHDTGSWNPASSKTRTILYKSISWLLMSWRRKDCVMIMITYELLNLRALKFSPLNKIDLFQCLGKIFVWNFKGFFEIPHKISYPYIERYFYTTLKF